MSVPSSTGTCRLPRSTRGSSGCGSVTSHGPVAPAGIAPGSPPPTVSLASTARSACWLASSPSPAFRRRPNTAHPLPLGPGRRAGRTELSVAVAACRAEAIVAAGRPGQGRHLAESHMLYPLHHQLRDAVATAQRDRPGRVGVEQDHLDLATVPRVDGAGSIDERDTVLRRQPRP